MTELTKPNTIEEVAESLGIKVTDLPIKPDDLTGLSETNKQFVIKHELLHAIYQKLKQTLAPQAI
jgi:predicted XRE-type DNA-binding protein